MMINVMITVYHNDEYRSSTTLSSSQSKDTKIVRNEVKLVSLACEVATLSNFLNGEIKISTKTVNAFLTKSRIRHQAGSNI